MRRLVSNDWHDTKNLCRLYRIPCDTTIATHKIAPISNSYRLQIVLSFTQSEVNIAIAPWLITPHDDC